MIQTVWPYLALMLLCAGLFPVLERATRWRLFEFLPPIVLIYLLVTALAAAGLWQVNHDIGAAQGSIKTWLVPGLLFLLMINCDLRAIAALGWRVLGAFFCATASLFIAFVSVGALFRTWLPADGWQPLAALSGSWAGGTANMVAVQANFRIPGDLFAMSLLTDAVCYSVWVAFLFSIARLAPAFNQYTGARSIAEMGIDAEHDSRPPTPVTALFWLAAAGVATMLAQAVAAELPTSAYVSTTTWRILLATGLGLAVAHTPVARLPGAGRLSGALLLFVVAVLASQSNFEHMGDAPNYLLAGTAVLLVHATLMVLAARLFHFDLYLCGIASLAHIGAVASAPLLAASYARSLVPVAILLALLGYVVGTIYGIAVGHTLSFLYTAAPGG